MSERNVLSFVLRGKNRVKVLRSLKSGPKISAQIEKDTGMYKSHANRTLAELQEWKLIGCTNPDDRSFKFYELTSEGKRVLEQTEKILSTLKRP